jgi:hypothetical protein
MPIELNEMLRSEAEKMSEFIVNDTKRTVEMFNFLKSQKGGSMVSEAIKVGANLVGDLLVPRAPLAARMALKAIEGANTLIEDEVPPPVVHPSEELLVNLIGKITALRDEAENNESLSCYFVDDKLHEIEKMIYDYLTKKGKS